MNNNLPSQPTPSAISPLVPKVDSKDSQKSNEQCAKESVFINSLPKREVKTHWSKTGLEIPARNGDFLVMKSNKLDTVFIKWQTKDKTTKQNLTKILKGDTVGPWHVRWLEGDDGQKYAVKVLDESQYAAELTDRNRHRKMLKHGFATQNSWMN